jgi:hypothetical protein
MVNPDCTVHQTGILPLEHKPVHRPAPRPGVEPGPRPSESRMMSVSPSGQKQGWKESNPLRLFWRQAAHPGAHPCQSVDRGGNRTHSRQALDLAALPVCVPRQQVRRAGDPPGARPALDCLEDSRLPAWLRAHSSIRAAEGEGVEPSRAFGLALCSTQVPSPIGLPFRCTVPFHLHKRYFEAAVTIISSGNSRVVKELEGDWVACRCRLLAYVGKTAGPKARFAELSAFSARAPISPGSP